MENEIILENEKLNEDALKSINGGFRYQVCESCELMEEIDSVTPSKVISSPINELAIHKHYEKPSVKRKKKSE